ncbi:MAG: viral A-type inclusion protein [Chitinophagaceae bacterium]
MKKVLLPFIALILLTACNNNDKKSEGVIGKDGPKTQADSLMNDVMDGHNVGMAKYTKLNEMEKKVKTALDSISKLPAKVQQASMNYKLNLESLGKDLRNAIISMDKWMDEFNMDSALNNAEQRIKYLTDEKLKVGKVKEAILGSLQKADSLLKAKL